MKKLLLIGLTTLCLSTSVYADDKNVSLIKITSVYSGKTITHQIDKGSLECWSGGDASINGNPPSMSISQCTFTKSKQKREVKFNQVNVIFEKIE